MSDIDITPFLKAANVRRVDIARALGVDKATVTRWVKGRVPAERVADVERVTGVSRHDLRPDIFGPPPPATSESGAAA